MRNSILAHQKEAIIWCGFFYIGVGWCESFIGA